MEIPESDESAVTSPSMDPSHPEHLHPRLPFKQNSNRSLDLGSMGSGPPMDGYFGMEHDAGEVSTSPHFDLLHEFAVDQMAAVKVEGMPVEGMPADSAVAAAAAAAAAGPNIGTAFPGEGAGGCRQLCGWRRVHG